MGEVLRRVSGKAIRWVLKLDIQEAAGPLQTATGLQGGAEAAIHAMRSIFDDEKTEAGVLVDASNAFNSLNRQVALHNVQLLCPQFATILINTYREPSKMYVLGQDIILSTEDTTQGDNLNMSFYAFGTTSLLNSLRMSLRNLCEPNMDVYLKPLDDVINNILLPAIFDSILTELIELFFPYQYVLEVSQFPYYQKLLQVILIHRRP